MPSIPPRFKLVKKLCWNFFKATNDLCSIACFVGSFIAYCNADNSFGLMGDGSGGGVAVGVGIGGGVAVGVGDGDGDGDGIIAPNDSNK